MKEAAAAAFDRSFYPEGAGRQLAAIYASGDRSAQLAELDVPTLVIHGRDDTLISPEGGEATAALIPGARLLLVSDMGHDVPTPAVAGDRRCDRRERAHLPARHDRGGSLR